MKILILVASLLSGFLLSSEKPVVGGLPVLPRSSLLVGAPPFFLMVTNAHENLRLQPEGGQPETGDATSVYPSISQNGRVVAYARLKASEPQRLVSISTYSSIEDKHTDYAEGDFSGAVAISPDASVLAYIAGDKESHRIHVIDLATKRDIIGPETGDFSRTGASWSPDSKRLAYNFNREIRIWDRDSGKISKLAKRGGVPVWSPSGEWIAYLDAFPYERSTTCRIVHPDGTAEKIVFQFAEKSRRLLVGAPVWAPDSNAILLNELADVDKGTVDVLRLDMKTLTMKTAFRDTARVLGWAKGE